MNPAFLEFTLVIVLATVFSLVFRFLKQPDVLAFLILGAILGVFSQQLGLGTFPLFQLFSDLGLTFLLFLIGLELSTVDIKKLGRPIAILGLLQLVFTFLFGFFLCRIFFVSQAVAIYFALALSFSSTVIVLRLLSSKGDLQALSGRLSVGILLVQDLAAVLALIVVTTYVPGKVFDVFSVLPVLLKALLLFGLVYYLAQNFFPWLFGKLARDGEVLFLLGIAWALGLAALVTSPWMGFSVEIGGFLAGMSLANCVQHYQIAARIRPLRDLFILIFFIYLGTHIDLSFGAEIIMPALWLTLAAVVVKPLIILTFMGILGYKKHTSFMTAISLGQISEFSLILVTLGGRLGHLEKSHVALITLVGAFSMTISTFMIHHSERFYRFFEPFLKLFERSQRDPIRLLREDLVNHAVLIGYGRKGIPILSALLQNKWDVLVIDTDPSIAHQLDAETHFLYGDINDEEIQEQANLAKSAVVISTAMNLSDDLSLLSFFRHRRTPAKVIVSAKTVVEAEQLYAAGAHYVLLPEHIAGQFLGGLIQTKRDFIVALEHFRLKEEKWLRGQLG